MPATIRVNRVLRVTCVIAVGVAVGAAPAAADPVTTTTAHGAVGSGDAVMLAPQVAVDPADPSRRVAVVRVHPGAPDDDGIRVLAHVGGAWSATDLDLTTGGINLVGTPTVAWPGGADALRVNFRGESAAGACTSQSGIYRSTSTAGPDVWNTPAIVLEDEAAARFTTPVSSASGGRVIVLALREAFADHAACAAGTPVESVEPVLWTRALPDEPQAPPEPLPIETAGALVSAPAIAPDPTSATVAVVVAWAEASVDGVRVVVRRCVRPVATWTCAPVSGSEHPIGPVAAPTTVLAPGVRPAVTMDADGVIHIAWGRDDNGEAEIRYRRATWSATDDEWRLSTERAIGTGSGDRLLPAIAPAANGRADIAFVDRTSQPAGTARVAQISIAPDGTRGSQVELGPAYTLPVVDGEPTAGDRVGVAALPGAGSGDLAALWTSAPDDPISILPLIPAPDALEGRLAHGTVQPDIVTTPITTPKNVAADVPDLYRAIDPDGDPVGIEFWSAGAGTVEGFTYNPPTDVAGTGEAVIMRLRELPGGTYRLLGRPVEIVNTTPAFPSPPAALTLQQGTAKVVRLAVADADVGERIAVVATGGPKSLVVEDVTATPNASFVDVRLTPAAGWRPDGTFTLTLEARDTTPAVDGTSVPLDIQVAVTPIYAALAVSADPRATDWKRIALDLHAVDLDQDGGASTEPFAYTVDWGDGSPATSIPLGHATQVVPAHRYATPGRRTIRVRAERARPHGARSASPWLEVPVVISQRVDAYVAASGRRISRTRARITVRLRNDTLGRTCFVEVFDITSGKRILSAREVQVSPTRATASFALPIGSLPKRTRTLGIRVTMPSPEGDPTIPLNRLFNLR